MEQNSKEWYEWRKKGIGSSDAPVVMGVSPYLTRYQLWEDKCNINSHRPKSQFILEKGHEVEKKVRSLYEIITSRRVPPALFVHKEFPFLRASVDGCHKGEKRLIEIKMQGEEAHERAKKGEIPQKYIHQIMHQLLVTGFEKVDFCSFCETSEENLHIVEVLPDKKLMDELLEEEKKFWKLVEKRVPPEFCDKDFKKIRVNGATKVIRELHTAHNELEIVKKKYNEKYTEFFNLISELQNEPRLSLDGHRLYQSQGGWKIDFKEVLNTSEGLPKLAEIWNAHIEKLPRVRGCNNTRTKLARARWKEHPDKDYWVSVVKRLEASSFCIGNNKQGWKANFDFLCRPETHFRVLEGKYDDPTTTKLTRTNISGLLNERI